ncbi:MULTISPECIES: hypothetical protein [Roseobacter]|nr:MULTISPECIES: hypothetical protein [Roseobacter]
MKKPEHSRLTVLGRKVNLQPLRWKSGSPRERTARIDKTPKALLQCTPL